MGSRMAKLARAIAAGFPHHVTQRGNRRQTVFFGDDDYATYVDLLAAHCRACRVSVWAWCLMPNHVHIVAAPADAGGLGKAIADTHRRYAWRINRRQGWRGNLWQGRFASCIMDEPHSLLALRYVERNPERANLVKRAEDWPWSSARRHLGLPPLAGSDDPLTDLEATRGLIDDWRAYLADSPPTWQQDALRQSTRTGRPLGAADFIRELEDSLGRRLRPNKRGPAAGPAAAKG